MMSILSNPSDRKYKCLKCKISLVQVNARGEYAFFVLLAAVHFNFSKTNRHNVASVFRVAFVCHETVKFTNVGRSDVIKTEERDPGLPASLKTSVDIDAKVGYMVI